jgi:predicted permease
MAIRSEWITRLRWHLGRLGRRSHFEGDLDDEVRFHIESLATELQARGLSPSDALAKARREFGSIARASEDSRDAWQFRWMVDLVTDLRYAIRSFRRSPGFTLTAVLSLALGIGANVAIFNALYTVLWKPLPVANPESLVGFSIWSAGQHQGGDLPVAFIRQLRSTDIFDGIAVTSADGLSFSYDGRAERVVGEVVSPNFFALLGVQPILGQPFTAGVRSGHWAAEAVLSYNFWKRRFGGDPGIIGRTIQLNTYPFTIIGVSPPGFFGLGLGTDFELRIPILPDGREIEQIAQIGARPDRGLYAIARLKPGATLARTEASSDAQLQAFLRATTLPRFRNGGLRHLKLAAVGKGDNGILDQFHTPLFVLFVLVALVLLIACANVSNMLLARSSVRAREFAVRTSIGAGRLRLMRQLLAESLLLSLFAGGLAVAVSNWAAGLLVHFLPQGHITLALDLHPDTQTLLFTVALSLLTSVLFGLAPAIQATRGNLAATLKADSTASIGKPAGAGFRKSLVVSQVAFSLVLLIAAGVFVRTMLDLRPTDYGAHPDRVLLFTMKPQQEIYTPVQRRILIAELVRRVTEIPGVQSAGVAEYGPFASRTSRDSIEAERGHAIRAETDWVTTGFLDAVGIPRIAGRDFTAADRPGSPFVAIVNKSLAHALFGDENPLGRRLKFSQDKDTQAFEIVGVVGNTHYYDVHAAPGPAAWFTFQVNAPYMPTLHVRTNRSDTAAMIAAVRHELDTVDKGFPIFNIKTLEARIEDSLARERMVANLSGAVGLLALALAAVGLYGILAYSVGRRTREIGIRMALGSDARSVLWMVAREALLLVAVGSLAGVVISVAAYRVLSHQLPGVSPIDVSVLTACAGIMLILAALAVSVPAIRACRVDPLTALRHE